MAGPEMSGLSDHKPSADSIRLTSDKQPN
jgi:hypothetical protein